MDARHSSISTEIVENFHDHFAIWINSKRTESTPDIEKIVWMLPRANFLVHRTLPQEGVRLDFYYFFDYLVPIKPINSNQKTNRFWENFPSFDSMYECKILKHNLKIVIKSLFSIILKVFLQIFNIIYLEISHFT